MMSNSVGKGKGISENNTDCSRTEGMRREGKRRWKEGDGWAREG